MAKLTHTAPQARDFSASERRALLSKGVAIVGAGLAGSASDPIATYHVSDNGQWRGFLRLELCAMVRELTDSEQRTLAGMRAALV
jgi:hypothetical protein